ncbi:AAA family ATPase [Virgibacillus sp. MSP4-1]|uniref:ParA family protein n=1 Tax=Virgibacillus sp. MSP4-1 TaxID=2700081 RepID=UPI0003A550F6|nr:AAA family ATPase [Virgibacillus sp. MSP4-1]QHS21440.1 AAA family ATPase [Virgibacillus sp. MSP4-1]
MPVISVMNYKGGVGKTTLSANIAAGIGNRGKRVLVIDLDPQANLTLSFVNIEEWKELDQNARTIKHWYDQYLDYNQDISVKELIISPSSVNTRMNQQGHGGQLDLICSHLELVEVDMELSSKLGGPNHRTIQNNYINVLSRLCCKINELKKDYDMVIIDCPPNFNLITQNAIVSSDFYIVPAKTDYLSTLGIHTLKKHVDSLKQKYNQTLQALSRRKIPPISPEPLGIIFTMVAYHGGIPISAQREYISQLKRSELPCFDHLLRENKTLFASAPESGVPVILKKTYNTQGEKIKSEIQGMIDEILFSIGKGEG